MKIEQAIIDKFAIGLSLICVIHCLVLPLILILFPGMVALQLDNEEFYTWIIIAVLPTSIYALTLGCKRHKRYPLLVLGFAGLPLLTMVVMLGEGTIGEPREKLLTVLGASLVGFGHLWNFYFCQQHTDCACPDYQKSTIRTPVSGI